MLRFLLTLTTLFLASTASATPPVLSYLFPAGGQRGTTVKLRVGGLFLHDNAQFEIGGDRWKTRHMLKAIPRIWFEGPILPLPESQQSEDYPVDREATIEIPKDTKSGAVRARVWTSQGTATGPMFVVGDLPEVVEEEIEGDAIAVPVRLPVTVNGRIFPREDIDLWAFTAKQGETITAFANTTNIHSPMVAKLEITDTDGNVLAEQVDRPGLGQDASVRFTVPADGTYHVRVRDVRNAGGPSHVYRLTITAGTVVDRIFPLGGKRGRKTTFALDGPAVPQSVEVPIPETTTTLPLHLGANVVELDVDDLPESVTTSETLSPPVILNGRVEKAASPSAWHLALKKGTKYEFELRARRLGSPLCGLVIVLDSAGKEVARGEAADPTADPTFAFQPVADGVYCVHVAERFRNRSGREYAYRLKVRDPSSVEPGFRLSLATESLNVPRGSTVKVKATVERLGGFTGTVELAAEQLPPGITAAKATIAEKQTATDMTFAADANAKVMPGTVTITGTSKTRTAKSELFVIATVPTPFKFTGEYTMSNSPRGQPYCRSYKLERNGFDRPVTISLADRQIRHLQGANGQPIVVPPNATEFTFAAQLPAWIETGRTCRVTLMAVGQVKDADGTQHTVAFTSTEQNHQMIVVPEPGRLGIDCDVSTLKAIPGKTILVPVRVSRAKGLSGEVKVELIYPSHWKGLRAKTLIVPENQDTGELEVSFDPSNLGPFNCPSTIRAISGDVVAETKLVVHSR
ncbi:PPC domain-containing protein [Limnoglobus roseus]|uniref:Pre-peptidase n=1 Tax=Limnoglobus roseus TaxID=2598579 RepID=A0A5C1AIE3_9BACT|nr:PPC domain-containing protein [Limnoglobus roseus]QEL17937.1 pre-peptidase [Limnoglobus roseus]